MSTKLLNATLLVGSVGAGAGGTYAGYESQYGTGPALTEETPTNEEEEKKEDIVPTQAHEKPSKSDVKTLIEWIAQEETLKTCSFRIEKDGEFKEINDTNFIDSDVDDLKDFLDKEKTNGLCSEPNKEVKLKLVEGDTKVWQVENETYRVKKLIAEKYSTEKRKCTFRFKTEGSDNYREIKDLKDEEVAGLFNFLNGDDTNGICPEQSGASRAPEGASNEEKIDAKGSGNWQQAPEAEEPQAS